MSEKKEEEWEREFEQLWQMVKGLGWAEGIKEDDYPVAKIFYFAGRRKEEEVNGLKNVLREAR